jgi:uncharacterized protein YgiM (DUF1202 family)
LPIERPSERSAERFEELQENDNPPTVEQIHEPTEEAKLEAFRDQVQAIVAGALTKAGNSSAANDVSFPSPLFKSIAVLLMELILIIMNGIVQVEYEPLGKGAPTGSVQNLHRPLAMPPIRLSSIVYVNADVLNLRAGPGTTQRVVATAWRGHTLVTLRTKGDWTRVLCVDSDAEGVECACLRTY